MEIRGLKTLEPTEGWWSSITSDSTGQYLAATADDIVYGSGIFTSNSYGSTWTQTSAPSENWWSITCDALPCFYY